MPTHSSHHTVLMDVELLPCSSWLIELGRSCLSVYGRLDCLVVCRTASSITAEWVGASSYIVLILCLLFWRQRLDDSFAVKTAQLLRIISINISISIGTFASECVYSVPRILVQLRIHSALRCANAHTRANDHVYAHANADSNIAVARFQQ